MGKIIRPIGTELYEPANQINELKLTENATVWSVDSQWEWLYQHFHFKDVNLFLF